MSPHLSAAVSRKNLWACLPRPARALVGHALSVLPPDVILGRRFRQARTFVAEAQWWPAEKARDYQLRRLRELCALAYQRTPYYRRLFDHVGFHPRDFRTLDDIRGLPFLDRDTVRERADDLLARSPQWRVDAVSTGGTSGMPLHFYIGANRSPVEYAYLTAGWSRVGYRIGDPLAVLKGDIAPPARNGLRHEYDALLRRHSYSVFHLSDADVQAYLAHIAGLSRCFLLAYPSVIAAITRWLQRSGERPPANICGIIAESEIVYPEQRASAEEVFGCRYLSLYGMTEKVVAAAECERSRAYHVWPTYGFFELVDESGRPVTTPGARGEIVGTSFINDVMPFIRYRTGDFATYVGARCDACGREHPLIENIHGHRTQESLVAADGSLIPWSAINMHDNTFLHVIRFQFAQDRPGRAVLRVVAGRGFTSADRERILRNLRRKLTDRIELRIEVVEALPVSQRGKAIYVDRVDAARTHAAQCEPSA